MWCRPRPVRILVLAVNLMTAGCGGRGRLPTVRQGIVLFSRSRMSVGGGQPEGRQPIANGPRCAPVAFTSRGQPRPSTRFAGPALRPAGDRGGRPCAKPSRTSRKLARMPSGSYKVADPAHVVAISARCGSNQLRTRSIVQATLNSRPVIERRARVSSAASAQHPVLVVAYRITLDGIPSPLARARWKAASRSRSWAGRRHVTTMLLAEWRANRLQPAESP